MLPDDPRVFVFARDYHGGDQSLLLKRIRNADTPAFVKGLVPPRGSGLGFLIVKCLVSPRGSGLGFLIVKCLYLLVVVDWDS